jgi:ESCRT-II complex subunit VPS36
MVASDPRLDLSDGTVRTPSPGPTLATLSLNDDITSSVKFSFRGGGEKIFFDRIKTALVQRKWLLSGAPPVPKPSESSNGLMGQRNGDGQRKLVGIAGLEMRGQQQRKNNEQIIGNAFEDLEALMTSAKEIVALAERFSVQARESSDTTPEADSLISQSASALGLATTKDMLGSDTLYISELSRNLAEFLLDDSKGILYREGGIMSLVDVWAVFNRARNGVELVSPVDFEKAAQQWEKLKLPVRLRRFKSGLLVVHGTDRTDERIISSILSWFKELRNEPPAEAVAWDWRMYGRGVTVQEAAIRFGWSMGVATEELEMAEERGVICRDHGLDGVRFWANWFSHSPSKS